jgi:hypothetical protein
MSASEILESSDDVTGGLTDLLLIAVALGLLAGVLDFVNRRLGTDFSLAGSIRRGVEEVWHVLTGYDNA